MRIWARRLLRWLLLPLLVLLVVLVAAWWWIARGSLAQLEGEWAVPGLLAAATITRDAEGVVTIDAANETDAARALGYVHAQERYFEMDLARRTAAGELSELFGARAVDTDTAHRVHRLRARTEKDLASFSGTHAAALAAYSEGANEGLRALRVRPWPYLLLRQAPKPWTQADSALAGYAMYFNLQEADNADELRQSQLKDALPAPLYALLSNPGTSWDAPLQGEAFGDAALPDAATLDLRTLPGEAMPAVGHEPHAPGSNNFAISGAHTADGRAIVANDMHLGLRAPGIWFRARLRYADPRAPGGRVDVQGFTLPGLPGVIVGSNGHVAWGFTNSYIDHADWKRLPACAASAPCALRKTDETIAVAHGKPVALRVRESDWGPVLGRDKEGRPLAVRWVAHVPGALNLNLTDFAHAKDLTELDAIADTAGVPAQNLVAADSGGRVGYRLIGARALRPADCDGRNPDNTCAPWGVTSANAPRVFDPADGRVWSANNRVLGGADLAQAGDAGMALGARAKQIANDLAVHERLDERQLLAVQLDNRAVFLQRWWALLQEEAQSDDAEQPALAALAKAAKHWDGTASTSSVSYRLTRAWRLAVNARLSEGLAAPARATLGKAFELPAFNQFEGIAWPLLQARPAHLLPKGYPSWDALLEAAAGDVQQSLVPGATDPVGAYAERTWGEQNRAAICHPLAGALPMAARSWLCMPPDELPGDTAMPRVQAPTFGASERMVVSPGHEADGIIEMPAGQSGHPMSPFWGAGHEAWVRGKPTPFLPGPPVYTLQLLPASR